MAGLYAFLQSVTALLSKADGEKMGGMAIKDEVQARALASRITAASFQVCVCKCVCV